MQTMKASVYHRYGPADELEVRDVPVPSPRSGAVRVQVHAAGLNPKDVLIRKGRMRWMSRGPFPRVPGYDVAGVTLDPWEGQPEGMPVYGMIQSQRGGACAEVAVLRPRELARMPRGLSFADAAGLPLAGLTALQALRDELDVRPGHHVLINGASGGVGTLAVQIARALGADVTAVCSGRNAELVRSLGANRVLDYTQTDPRRERGLDQVFDVFGNLGWPAARRMLSPKGRFCTTIPRLSHVARGVLRRVGLHRAALVIVQSHTRDLEQLAAWIEAGTLRPVVDRVVSLDEASAGHRHLETRRAKGKVVVSINAGVRA
ncbi:MAG: NAD(P)-dependent alcohol dehydrogenase [Myxococcota bacterium]